MLIALWVVGMGIWFELGSIRKLIKKQYETKT
jgi:hypothetical protein